MNSIKSTMIKSLIEPYYEENIMEILQALCTMSVMATVMGRYLAFPRQQSLLKFVFSCKNFSNIFSYYHHQYQVILLPFVMRCMYTMQVRPQVHKLEDLLFAGTLFHFVVWYVCLETCTRKFNGIYRVDIL